MQCIKIETRSSTQGETATTLHDTRSEWRDGPAPSLISLPPRLQHGSATFLYSFLFYDPNRFFVNPMK